MMKKKLSSIMIFMLLFQFVSGIFATSAGAAVGATPAGITVTTHVYGETVLGQDTIVYITTKNTSGAWAYNVGLELVLDDGLQISNTQSPAPKSTTGTSAAQQTVYWQDIKDLAPGESFEFPVKVKSLDTYRIGIGQVPFKAKPSVTVKVHASADARIINDPPNGLSKTSSPLILTIMPFSITVKNPGKQVKGAGAAVDDLLNHSSEWGEGLYEYTILNNTRYPTTFNALTSLLAGSLEAYGFTGLKQPSNANIQVGSTQRSSQWSNLTVNAGATEILTFKAAFLNNKDVLSNTNNNGAVLLHGSTVSNTIQYDATVNSVPFNSVSDSTNIVYESTPMDIIINKKVDKSITSYQDILTYTLTITTNEYYEANDIVVTDIIGNGQTFVAYGPQSGLINATDGAPTPDLAEAKANDGTTKFTWHIGTMLPKKSVTLKYTTKVDTNWSNSGPFGTNPLFAGDNIDNWSQVTATTVPSGTVSDSDWTTVPIKVPTIKEEITSINSLPLVLPSTNRVAKATVGDIVNFKLTYDATGINAKQHGVKVYDFLPLGTLPKSAENIDGTEDVAVLTGLQLNGVNPEYVADLHALIWTLPDLSETTTTLVANVPVIVNDSKEYVKLNKSEENLVVLSYKNSPGHIKSERDTVKLEYVEPNIGLSRKIDTTTVNSTSVTVNGNQTVLVSVYLENKSTTSTAYNVKFIDTLPSELTNPTIISDTFTGSTQLAFEEISSIAPNDTVTLKYMATVINPIGALKTISQESIRDYYSRPSHTGRHYDPTVSDYFPVTKEISHVTMITEGVAITKQVVDSTSPSHSANDVQVGDNVVYKVEVTLPAKEVTYDAYITDYIPAGQTLLNVYASNQYTPSTHTAGTPLVNVTDYLKSGLAGSAEQVKIPNSTFLPVIPGVSNSTPIYTYFIETKVVRITNTSNTETQKSKAQIDWKDKSTGGTAWSKQSSDAQVIVSKPNLRATITPLNANMEKDDTQTIVFTLENIGESTAYDFVPTIKLPAGFKVADLADTTPLLQPADVSGNINDGFTLTYAKRDLAKAAIETFTFPLMLVQVKGSGSSHHVDGASGVYYSTHTAFVENSTSANEKFPTVTASSTIKVRGLDLTNKIIGTSNGTSPGNITQIRPGDLLDYELQVTIPDGTKAYNLIVEDTLPSLSKFDVIGTDLDGSVATVTSSTYKYTFTGEIDASLEAKTKTIVLHLRAKTDGSFATSTENATSSAIAKWETAPSGGDLLTISPAKVNTIAVIRPILAITATPVISNSEFATNNTRINVQYLLTNTGAGKAYGTNVEVPILPGLAVVESSIKAGGSASGNLIDATGGSGGKVVWNNLTVNENNTLVLSFDVELSSNSPILGAGVTLLDLVAALKQYQSIADPIGNQHSKTYMPNQPATHTLSVAPISIAVSVTANTYMLGNTTKVRPGDQLTYHIDLNTVKDSKVYHPVLNLTGLVDQEIIRVKQGSTVIDLTDDIGYILTADVVGKSPISTDAQLTVETRVNTNTNYGNPHDASFKPTISYKTSNTNGDDKSATVPQLVQSVVEPVLTLAIIQDKPELTTPGEEVTYTVTVGNASGNSDAFNAILDLGVSSKIYLSQVDLAEAQDLVTSSKGPTGNGTIHWTIGSIPKGGSAILKFKAAAKDATTVTTAIYGEAKLKEYYSIPASVTPGDGGKKYTSLLTSTANGVVEGRHALDLTNIFTVTAGKSREFPHTLKNNSAGRDTFTLTLQNGIYPTDLFAGTDMINPIAKGKLDEGVWKWEILNLIYSSNGNSTGDIVVDLAAGATIALKLVVNVPVTTQYDNQANTTVLQAVSKYHTSPVSIESVNDVLTVIGTPLDGWVGSQLPIGALAPRVHNPTTINDWILPVFGQYDSMTIQAVSAVNVEAVKAIYTVNSVVYETNLTRVNADFVNDGYKQWTGVSRLPFSVTTGTYGIIYKAFDAANTPVLLETDTYDVNALNVGGNNWFKIRQSLTVEGTITDLITHNNLTGAKVVLYDPLNKIIVATLLETTSNGHYSFPNISVGEYELQVTKTGYSQSTKRFYALPENDISNVVIVDAALSQYKITLTANPSTILGDGVSQSILTALVSDNEGLALEGVTVTFTAPKGTFSSSSTGTFVPTSINAVTDEHGIAHVQFKSDIIAGTASVRFPVNADVADPTNNLYANGQIIVTFDPGAIVGIVTETVKDDSGNLVSKPVKGAIVKVSKKQGNEIIFSGTMTTAEDGAYKIAIPVGGTDYDVTITKPMLVGGQTQMVDFPQLAHVGTISPGIYKEFPAEKTGSGLLITKTQSGQQTLLTVAVAQKIQGYLIKVIDPSLPQVAPIPVFINDNGTFNAPNLDPGTYQFAITYKDGGLELILGSKMPTIVIGTNGAIVGEMNIALGLVDPYGTVTDASNNLPLSGAHVTLYYADTPRNRANVITPPLGQIESPVPGTPVKSLPLIPGFDPFDNLNPEQITLLDGEYAWMVFDKTDYYVVTTKPGYYSDRSPILSVDGAIVMYNPKLTPIPAPAAVQPGPATPTPTPNPQVDLAVQILSDRAAYAEESIVTFTINYVNKSDVTVKGASVKAQIPQYTDVSDAAGGNITGSDITWTLGDLAPKATGTIIYKVKVKANSLPQAEVKVTNEAVIASTEALINPEDDKSPLSILLFTSRFGDQGHERYIKGYPDGNFKPNRAITRAEIAAIFSRIMNLQSTVTGEKFYNDISRTFWAKEYIETATRVGLFTGYADGGFKPDAPITRAELSTVIFRYLKLTDRTPIKLDFTDIETHWAKNAIEEIFRYHIITGYPDKTFRPGADMIRTEAVTMINRLLNRGPLYGAEVSFPDVNATHWAFGQVEESAITHEYKRFEDGSEQLTKYIPEPLW